MIDTEIFWSWLLGAPGGQNYSYHYGILANDREANPALDKLANVVHKAAEEGYVYPFSVRFVGQWAYFAKRSSKGLRSFGPAALAKIKDRILHV